MTLVTGQPGQSTRSLSNAFRCIHVIFVPKYWHPINASKAVVAIDGKDVCDRILRRRVGLSLEYRAMTEEENRDDRWMHSIR